ncbi:MAG: hypothetical protein ABI091_29770 [Ferruginibacter sp.]
MKKIIFISILGIGTSFSHAQLLKKLKDKVNKSAKNVTNNLKAAISLDRIIEHAAK